MIHCELCAYDERFKFRYATMDRFREHLDLVHGIILAEDGCSVKAPTDPSGEPPRQPSIVIPRPRR